MDFCGVIYEITDRMLESISFSSIHGNVHHENSIWRKKILLMMKTCIFVVHRGWEITQVSSLNRNCLGKSLKCKLSNVTSNVLLGDSDIANPGEWKLIGMLVSQTRTCILSCSLNISKRGVFHFLNKATLQCNGFPISLIKAYHDVTIGSVPRRHIVRLHLAEFCVHLQ